MNFANDVTELTLRSGGDGAGTAAAAGAGGGGRAGADGANHENIMSTSPPHPSAQLIIVFICKNA